MLLQVDKAVRDVLADKKEVFVESQPLDRGPVGNHGCPEGGEEGEEERGGEGEEEGGEGGGEALLGEGAVGVEHACEDGC